MSKNKIDKRFINIYRVKRAYQKHVQIGFNGFDPQNTNLNAQAYGRKSPENIISEDFVDFNSKNMQIV